MRWAVLILLLGSGALPANDEMASRCVAFGEMPDSRVAPPPQIAPGPPPATSFRFYEGKLHHRFGNAELLLDDAGH